MTPEPQSNDAPRFSDEQKHDVILLRLAEQAKWGRSEAEAHATQLRLSLTKEVDALSQAVAALADMTKQRDEQHAVIMQQLSETQRMAESVVSERDAALAQADALCHRVAELEHELANAKDRLGE